MFSEVLMLFRSKNSSSLTIFSENALKNSNHVSRKEAMFVFYLKNVNAILKLFQKISKMRTNILK